MANLRRFTCCCCGALALAYAQWWNRDTGFGLCGACARSLQRTMPADEFLSYYGREGEHWIKEAPNGRIPSRG